MEQPLPGILLVPVAEDKEGSGRLQIGNKIVMTYVSCTHNLLAKSHGLYTGKVTSRCSPMRQKAENILGAEQMTALAHNY